MYMAARQRAAPESEGVAESYNPRPSTTGPALAFLYQRVPSSTATYASTSWSSILRTQLVGHPEVVAWEGEITGVQLYEAVARLARKFSNQPENDAATVSATPVAPCEPLLQSQTVRSGVVPELELNTVSSDAAAQAAPSAAPAAPAADCSILPLPKPAPAAPATEAENAGDSADASAAVDGSTVEGTAPAQPQCVAAVRTPLPAGCQLLLVGRTGTECSRCSWSTGCVGCEVPFTEAVLDLRPADYLAVQWPSSASFHAVQPAQDASAPDGNFVSQHQSVTLEDCFDAFTRREVLGQDDLWYCPACRAHRPATKQFELWKLPDILVVHLKRFHFSQSTLHRDKIDALVTFPLQGLNLTRFVPPEALADLLPQASVSADVERTDASLRPPTPSPDRTPAPDAPAPPASAAPDGPLYMDAVYDCIAVGNHMGVLSGGHYTAYALNAKLGAWYLFDDTFVSPVTRLSDIVDTEAYILLYQRRTAQFRSLRSLMRAYGATARTQPEPQSEPQPQLQLPAHDDVRNGPMASSAAPVDVAPGAGPDALANPVLPPYTPPASTPTPMSTPTHPLTKPASPDASDSGAVAEPLADAS